MSKKSWKTAKDLMVELKADSDYLQKRKEMDEKFRRLEERYLELARPILERLRSEGFESDSIEHLVKKYVPLSSQVVSISLEHLEPGQDDRYCESLVRALGAARESFDGRRLASVYDKTCDESLRWAIANTIALTHPHSIDIWIASASDDSTLKRTLLELCFLHDQ